MIKIKNDVDEAAKTLPELKHVIVFEHAERCDWQEGRDLWFELVESDPYAPKADACRASCYVLIYFRHYRQTQGHSSYPCWCLVSNRKSSVLLMMCTARCLLLGIRHWLDDGSVGNDRGNFLGRHHRHFRRCADPSETGYSLANCGKK